MKQLSEQSEHGSVIVNGKDFPACPGAGGVWATPSFSGIPVQ